MHRQEGCLTVAVAILGYFTIPDFPEDVKWLTPDEKEWVKGRLQQDVGKSGREAPSVKFKDLKVIFTDYKVFVSLVSCVVWSVG
jgi:hypothetical protein